MALVDVKPTRIDTAIADKIADDTNSGIERTAQTLTWAADEHVLLALAAAGWLYIHLQQPQQRPIANHVLAVSLATAFLPHVLKSVFDQIRPDRLTLRGHRHGVPISGHPRDSFPSGHAVHMGALASAAGLLPKTPRRLVRTVAVGVSLTRIAVLAHWASDVVAGFAFGAAVERLMRPWTLAKPRGGKDKWRESP